MPACGLDFGTSNSTLGVNLSDKVQMSQLEGHHSTIPSAMFYEDDGSVYYGRAAIQEFTDGMEGRLLRSLKSILGSDLMSQKTQLAGRKIAFTDILCDFVKHLKQTAEQQSKTTLESVVLGRPVHFVDEDSQADKQAETTLRNIANQAGFKHIEFQYEPIAAAFAYEHTLAQEELTLIIDIGGGTADFSIVRVSPKRKLVANRAEDVLANAGVHVGGTDFDKQLSLHSVMPHLGMGSLTTSGITFPTAPFFDLSTWHRIHGMYNTKYITQLRKLIKSSAVPDQTSRLLNIVEHQQGHRLLGKVEDAKIDLAQSQVTTLRLDFIENGLQISTTRNEFEDSIQEELNKLSATVSVTLAQAGLQPRDISAVFLTGGSTAIPAVKQATLQQFSHAKIIEGDRFGSVGYGLTLQAGRMFT